MNLLTPTIEEEAIEKFIATFKSLNSKFQGSYARDLLKTKILSTNKDIHKFVISISKLITFIKPELKHNSFKLERLGGTPLIPIRREVELGVKNLNLDPEVESKFTSLILRYINHV